MEDENLVTRRSKRSTAGNRMQAALAEMSVDDLMQDVEEDVDFVSKGDEEDVFESDFASTDEEEKGDGEAAEKALQDEEKRARRAARLKIQVMSKPSPRKVVFSAPALDSENRPIGSKPKSKASRRVSLGLAVDAETGEVLEINKRQSQREATRLNTQELQSRLRTAEDRKAVLTKRPKLERRKTQAELITAALDMEEENTQSHRLYLLTEEEKRKKARVVKASTVGPKVRWRSRGEEVTVTVYDPVPQVHRPTWTSPYMTGTNDPAQPQAGMSFPNPYSVPSGHPSVSTNSQPNTTTYHPNAPALKAPLSSNNGAASTSGQTVTPTASTAKHQPVPYYPYQYYTPPSQGQHAPYQPYGQYYAYQPPHLQLHPQSSNLVARKTTEKQAKNYVELLLNEERPQDRPTWRETMDSLFGKHADWDSIRVYIGKNRPHARQIQTCPVTGLQARYQDPRTGVPYANAGAFRILTRLLEHEYVWSPFNPPGTAGVFVGHEKQRGAIGAPNGWGDAMAGVDDSWRQKRTEGSREEKVKDKEKEKEKVVRVGERRSSRIMNDNTGKNEPQEGIVDDLKSQQ